MPIRIIRISAAALCHCHERLTKISTILRDRYEYNNNNVLLRILQILNSRSESVYRTNHLCMQNLYLQEYF